MKLAHEKRTEEQETIRVTIDNSRITGIHQNRPLRTAYRVWNGSSVGFHFQNGAADDESGFAQAAENLYIGRAYPFPPESGTHSRDLSKQQLSETELLSIAQDCLDYVAANYPCYRFFGYLEQTRKTEHWENDNGMDYSSTDCVSTIEIAFCPGADEKAAADRFSLHFRTFDRTRFERAADFFLAAYDREIPVSEAQEILNRGPVLCLRCSELLPSLNQFLDAGEMKRGSSLLSQKTGERVFSERFTLVDDLSDEGSWLNRFWDGEGFVRKHEKLTLIDRGTVVSAFSDKELAEKWQIPHTQGALPNPRGLTYRIGGQNLRIIPDGRPAKELLGERACIIPLTACSNTPASGFQSDGSLSVTLYSSLLYHHGQVVGRFPSFIETSSLFELFGKHYIGVGADMPGGPDSRLLFIG